MENSLQTPVLPAKFVRKVPWGSLTLTWPRSHGKTKLIAKKPGLLRVFWQPHVLLKWQVILYFWLYKSLNWQLSWHLNLKYEAMVMVKVNATHTHTQSKHSWCTNIWKKHMFIFSIFGLLGSSEKPLPTLPIREFSASCVRFISWGLGTEGMFLEHRGKLHGQLPGKQWSLNTAPLLMQNIIAWMNHTILTWTIWYDISIHDMIYSHIIQSLKLTVRTWKWMSGRWVSFLLRR